MTEDHNQWLTRDEAIRMTMFVMKCDRQRAEEILDEEIANGSVEVKEVWKQ